VTNNMENKPKRRWRFWCCSLPMILVGIAVAGIIISMFVMEKRQEDKLTKRGKPETHSEIFNSNFLPDYTVSAENEEKFNQKIIALLEKDNSGMEWAESTETNSFRPPNTEEKIANAKSDMQFLKDYYPEGYYLVVDSVLNIPDKSQIFPNLYQQFHEAQSRIDMVVHEISHIGRFEKSIVNRLGYIIEDKFITVNHLPDDLPGGDELLQYISELTSMDGTYLKDAKQDIYTTLDEIISYTKSLRVARAYAYYQKGFIDEDRGQALSRQLYFLSLHLKNLKENHPNLWQRIKKEKGFIYVMLRETSIAKTEIQAARDESSSGSSGDVDFASSVDKNLSLFNANQSLFDELSTATGLDTMGNLQNLTSAELSKLGIRIEKF